MTQTVAEALVAQLAAAGVERIYGVIGDAVFPLVDALAKQSEVQFVTAVHETNAAYMASYEAKLTGRLTACMATSGPGATNLATGLADAFFDGAPVIALTGQVPAAKIGTDAKQYFDQQTFFRPVTASTTEAVGAESALHGLLAAMSRSVTASTATHVSIPKDVLQMPVQWTPLALQSELHSTSETAETSPPQPYVLGDPHAAIERLHSARRPLLIIGTSDPAAVRDGLDLAASLNAGVVAAQQAKGAVPFDHELLIGGIGEAHVPQLINDVDLMILIGEAPYETRFIPPTVPSIVIAPTHRLLPKHPVLAGWFGPMTTSLRTLRPKPDAPTHDEAHTPRQPWLDAIRAARQDLFAQAERLAHIPDGQPCNPYVVSLQLAQHSGEDAVIAVDVGAFSHWFDLGFRVRRQTVLASPRWRGIGFALPAAIGARFAQPGRQVVAITGDGAFLQSLGELTTAVRYKLPLLIVVVNNAVYDIERQKLVHEGFNTLGTELPTPDFVAFAEGCGAIGLRAATNGDIEGALKEAFDKLAHADRPVVLDVHTTAPVLPHLTGSIRSEST